MLTRRTLLLSSLALAILVAEARLPGGAARAADPAAAAAFIQQTGQELIGIVNGAGGAEQKQAALQQVIDRAVDVNAVAQFCLGRYWRTANEQQRQEYLRLFHRVLMKSITGHLGDYQGVTFAMGRSVARGEDTGVQTVINRPGAASANVEWVVSSATGSPKIIDVVAEGTSMRLTQRSDYDSYISRNGGSVQALLTAMQRQAGAG